ncbi:GNAT family N-acetyltransferase [Ensifer aridi]|uniref:GNAT family N-acetyltransferase n=1 Tax=Ensifer aridi TaxID=1708715 RepID=UPI003B835614
MRLPGAGALGRSSGGLGGYRHLRPPHEKVPGAGTALFAATKAYARDAGFLAINATIRADNIGGLAYYSKMGFVDYKVDKAVPLKDGRPVDRISKRYLLAGL